MNSAAHIDVHYFLCSLNKMRESGSLVGIWRQYKFAIQPKDCTNGQASYQLDFHNLVMAFVVLAAAHVLSMGLLLCERICLFRKDNKKINTTLQHLLQ